jgi:hypothetical protein
MGKPAPLLRNSEYRNETHRNIEKNKSSNLEKNKSSNLEKKKYTEISILIISY